MTGIFAASTATNPLAPFDHYVTEAEVCKRFSRFLGARELREARRKKEIEFLNGKKGAILYNPDSIAEYLKRKITPCQPQQNGFGNIEASGSAVSLVPTTFTPTGGTSESDELVAKVLIQKFSRKPKNG
ncbi:hypothetical protein [Bradyrhizobium sp. USDA 3315]